MKYLDKSFSVPVTGGDNYERIFGHSGPKVDIFTEPPRSSSKKNEDYRIANKLKEDLRDSLCTHTECDIPNDRNVKKMLYSEFKAKKKVEEFKNRMKSIGADPRDYDVNRLRRR